MSGAIAEFIDLSVGYDRPVLEHVDLQIGEHEIVAILGGSGSGKTTLLLTLCGLLPPLSGDVRLFDKPVYELAEDERNALLRRVGLAFQSDALFSSLTVEDNVALPLRELTALPDAIVREMVHMRLELVGIGELGRRYRTQLSGGQRKRASLARASILDPKLILCDEPTAGLDPVASAEIDDTLLRFRDTLGSTVVVVSHELATIRAIADRAVMLAHGTIAAVGSVDELAHSRQHDVYEFFHARAG